MDVHLATVTRLERWMGAINATLVLANASARDTRQEEDVTNALHKPGD